MTERLPPGRLSEEVADPSDLVKRLANYRSRVAREGRQAALDRLDRAIEEARRQPGRLK